MPPARSVGRPSVLAWHSDPVWYAFLAPRMLGEADRAQEPEEIHARAQEPEEVHALSGEGHA